MRLSEKGMRRQAGSSLLVLALTLACASCSHFEKMGTADVVAQELVGYSVRIRTTEGRKLEFRVLQVTKEGLYGDSHEVRFDEIRTLERREFGIWETAGFAALLVAAGFGLLVWSVYGSRW